MLALSGLCEGRARGVLSLHTACPERSRRAPISVPKTPAPKSCACLTSKLIENKPASSPLFRSLTKNRGEGELSIVPTGIPLAVIPSLFSSHLHSRISFFQSLAHSFIFRITPIPYPSSTFRTLCQKPGGTPLWSHQSSRRSPPPIKKPLLCAPPQRTLRLCGESLFSLLACPP